MQKVLLSLALSFSFFLSFSQWTQTNGPEGGDINEIIQLGSTVFLNARSGGIFKSLNNGASWEPSSSGIPVVNQVQALLEDDGILYVSLYQAGVYKSVDKGNNWIPINSGIENVTIYSLLVDGTNIYAANANGGINISNDAGQSWSFVGGVLADTQFQDFQIFNSKVYAAGRKLYESSDQGITWQEVAVQGIGPNGIRSMHVDDGVFYIASDGEIITSSDNLISWSTSNVNAFATILNIVSHEGLVYATTGRGRYYYTADQGNNWAFVQTPNPNNFIRDLFFSTTKIIVTTAEGLYESFDSGDSWSLNNNGIRALPIASIFANEEAILAGSYGQGIFRSIDNGNSWNTVNDGLNSLNSKSVYDILEINNKKIIAAGGGVYASVNNGNAWENTLDLGDNGESTVLASDNEILVAGTNNGLYRSLDFGETWSPLPISVLNQISPISGLLIDGANIIVGSGEAELFLSEDSGATWGEITIPNGYNLALDIELVDGRLYVASVQGVFVSEDLGQNWQRFNNSYISAQDILVTDIGVLAATDNGLYVTREDLDIWYQANNGLGERWINGLPLQNEIIYAGTATSGVWKLPFAEAFAVLPEPEQSDFALRINTGGPEVIWSGETFIADQYRTGGKDYTVDFPISDTTNNELYQTEIYGPRVGPFTYEIPLETPGEYDIRLHFAELYFGVQSGGIGSRVFNVSIEGDEVLSNFDILNEVAPATALIKEFNNIEVSDGFATIEFTGVTQRAKISAIEILGHNNASEDPTLTLIGEAEINLELGENYIELGASAIDASGVDISADIVVGGDVVDTSIAGTYVVTYDVSDSSGNNAERLFRTVNVTDGSSQSQNPADSDINLALVTDAVLSGTSGTRGSLEAILYDPITENYFVPTAYNEYGVGFRENLGRPDADDGFVWRVDWSSAKLINYITFGGTYPNQPQPNSLWRISYLNNGSWTVIEEGQGGWIDRGIFEWGGSSQSPISAKALRVQVYSDEANDLVSIHLRGRGGISNFTDDSATTTKATLIQYLPSEASLPFVTTWKTDNPGSSDDNQITIPTFPGETYDYTVDWGDGIITTGETGDTTHTYATSGTYQVSISGTFPRIYFFNASVEKDNDKLVAINQWGQTEWKSMERAFYECKNMDMLTSDIPDLSNVSNMGSMFDGCTNFIANASISEWATSTITNMNGVFQGTYFNQDIGSWNTSLVESMDTMFYSATSFNQDIGDWDVSNLIQMVQMFEGAKSFNQDISDWDVSNVMYMWDAFFGAISFDQNLASWDVSKVEIFSGFLENTALSDENYNNILIGWSQLPSLRNDLTLDTAQNQFCDAKVARQFIIDTYNWTINDAGESEDCEILSDFALRINTGGVGVAYNGETYVGDTYFDTGRTLDRPQTGLPEPYQTFRFSRSQQMGYDIPIPDGEYTVNLHFAELWFGATGGGSGGVGKRVFDVSIEGQLIEDNLDIFAEVGAETMLIKAYTVTVTGGILDIDFDSRDAAGGERHPVINAIEILGASNGSSGKIANGGMGDDNNMSLYPNHVSYFATVSFEKATDVQQVYVFDMIGRLIKTYSPMEIKNGNDYIIDVNQYQQGPYIIKMIDNKGVNFQKQMIIKR